MNDAYDVIKLPVSFTIDEADLHKRFIALSAENHPDRFTDALDQADAAERLAVINRAYRDLRDPESRANVLLQRLGGASKEADKSLPADLLTGMMEVRERQEEAVANQDQGTLRELAHWARDRRQEHLQRIATLFAPLTAAPDQSGGRDTALRQIRQELNALRYFQRMLEQLPGTSA